MLYLFTVSSSRLTRSRSSISEYQMRSSIRYEKSNRVNKAIPEDVAIIVVVMKVVAAIEDVDVVREVEVAVEGGVRAKSPSLNFR